MSSFHGDYWTVQYFILVGCGNWLTPFFFVLILVTRKISSYQVDLTSQYRPNKYGMQLTERNRQENLKTLNDLKEEEKKNIPALSLEV